MQWSLQPHPRSHATSVDRITVEATREAGDRLRLRYVLGGDIVRLKLSPSGTPERRDGLWQTTCCEVFIAGPDSERYYEFNLSPSTAWAAYRFDGYRDHMTDLEVPAPVIAFTVGTDEVVLETTLSLHGLPRLDGDWRLGLTTVVEDRDGAKGWWGLTHGSDEPDFHAMTSFIAALPAPLTAGRDPV